MRSDNRSTVFVVTAADQQAALDFGLNLTDEQITEYSLARSRYNYPASIALRPVGQTTVTHYAGHTYCTPDELAYFAAAEDVGLVSVNTLGPDGKPLEGKPHLEAVIEGLVDLTGVEMEREPGVEP